MKVEFVRRKARGLQVDMVVNNMAVSIDPHGNRSLIERDLESLIASAQACLLSLRGGSPNKPYVIRLINQLIKDHNLSAILTDLDGDQYQHIGKMWAKQEAEVNQDAEKVEAAEVE